MALTNTGIDWTDLTWNPVTGCTKISQGCKHCYAEPLAKDLQRKGVRRYADGFEVRTHENALQEVIKTRKPSMVFVNSMSDLFHKDVPDEFIMSVFKTMLIASQHTYQILTKRSKRLLALSPSLPWRDHIWQGVSIEDKSSLFRIDDLRKTRAHLKFLSVEPLLEDLGDFDLTGIDWVIIGGESGPNCRPMERGWVASIRDKTVMAGIPLYFKQWGGYPDKRHGPKALLDGKLWQTYPERQRENVLF